MGKKHKLPGARKIRCLALVFEMPITSIKTPTLLKLGISLSGRGFDLHYRKQINNNNNNKTIKTHVYKVKK
jgi:hypothetical protein